MADQAYKAAQGISIVGAALLSGFIACFSHAGVPTLSLAPADVLVHQFKVMYNIGKSTSPAIAILVTVCNAVSAYHARMDPPRIGGLISPFPLYVAAAICIPCIIPFTVLYMDPVVNNRLLALGARVEKGENMSDLGINEEEIRASLGRWRWMNFARALMVGIGALLAVVAAMA